MISKPWPPYWNKSYIFTYKNCLIIFANIAIKHLNINNIIKTDNWFAKLKNEWNIYLCFTYIYLNITDYYYDKRHYWYLKTMLLKFLNIYIYMYNRSLIIWFLIHYIPTHGSFPSLQSGILYYFPKQNVMIHMQIVKTWQAVWMLHRSMKLILCQILFYHSLFVCVCVYLYIE